MQRIARDIVVERSDRILNEYSYIKDKSSNYVTYYYCALRDLPCTGRAITKNGVMSQSKQHSHPPDPLADEKYAFRRALKYAVQYSDPTISPKFIFDIIRDFYPEAAEKITYPSIERTMSSWKLETKPPTPHDVMEFHNILQQEMWQPRLHYSRGNMTTQLIITNNSPSLLMLNADFVKLFHGATQLFCDGTFQVTPKIPGVSQLFVIMLEKYQHVFPVAWALMANKNTSSYRNIFEAFANVAPEIRSSQIMGDFENAIRNAALAIYDSAIFHGCNSHFLRAVHKQFWKNREMRRLMTHYPEIKETRNKLVALSYLPANVIPDAYAHIKDNASVHVQRLLNEVFNYFENFWINRVTPANFSVYRIQRRTNNSVESHNSILASKIKTHPSAWEFIGRLVNVLSSAHTDFESVSQGLNVTRGTRIRVIIRDELLQQLWTDYDNGLPIAEFLDRGATLFNAVMEMLNEDFEED